MDVNASFHHIEKTSNSRGALFISVREKVVRRKGWRMSEANDGTVAIEGLRQRFSTFDGQ